VEGVAVRTLAEQPDLLDEGYRRTRGAVPEYNQHGDVVERHWGRLADERAPFQFFLLGDGGQVLARGSSLPIRWDGTLDGLPAGIDGALLRGLEEPGDPSALCAMFVAVADDARGRGLARVALSAMREIAVRHGFRSLIAPVRPSFKERYPLVPIERYAAWRRSDGLCFDPWMRVHERLGATILKSEPCSLRITGTVSEWEAWTQMAFPETGDYWFPGGLATLAVSHEADEGRYFEPNVWMRHTLLP
jgi:GNAT superfamily N-acetyltransferase